MTGQNLKDETTSILKNDTISIFSLMPYLLGGHSPQVPLHGSSCPIQLEVLLGLCHPLHPLWGNYQLPLINSLYMLLRITYKMLNY